MFGSRASSRSCASIAISRWPSILARCCMRCVCIRPGQPQADDITIVLVARRAGSDARTKVAAVLQAHYDSLDAIFAFIEVSLPAGRSMPSCARP